MPGWPPCSGSSQNFQGRFNGPRQGPSTSRYYGTTHTPYDGSGDDHSAAYDTPRPPSHQSPGFVPRQSQRPRFMNPPWSISPHSAGVWDAFAGSHPFQTASEPGSHYTGIPGGFFCELDVQYMTAASLSKSAARGPYSTFKKRKALVIGTNFPKPSDPRYRLECCTEDAYCVADFLEYTLGFAHHDIHIITDDEPYDLPTKDNILKAMRALVHGAQPGDSFFFYFSGHGMQIKDMEGDELDGLDECICAMDYRGGQRYQDCNTPGLIVDDTMHEIMVEPLPPQCRLTAIFDCCHSGTILDLPVVYNSKGAAKPFIHPDGPWVRSQKLSSADVVSLSASKDNQEAAESPEGGVLLRAFIDSMSRYCNTLTYNELVSYMRDYMVRHGFDQKPQLSASHRIDTNCLFVI